MWARKLVASGEHFRLTPARSRATIQVSGNEARPNEETAMHDTSGVAGVAGPDAAATEFARWCRENREKHTARARALDAKRGRTL